MTLDTVLNRAHNPRVRSRAAYRGTYCEVRTYCVLKWNWVPQEKRYYWTQRATSYSFVTGATQAFSIFLQPTMYDGNWGRSESCPCDVQLHRGECRQSKWGNRIRQIERARNGGKQTYLSEALCTKVTTWSIRLMFRGLCTAQKFSLPNDTSRTCEQIFLCTNIDEQREERRPKQ